MADTTRYVGNLALLLAACNGSQSSAPLAQTPRAVPETNHVAQAPRSSEAEVRSFDSDPIDAPPAGWSFGRTGNGRAGRWVVRAEPGAPSGANVLAQLDADNTDYRYPVAVTNASALRDAAIGVRCKPVSGRVDQACGLIARYRDEKNYLLTRANALEGNVRLYAVKDGNRRQLASWSGDVTSNAWHDYRFELRSDHLEVFWEGQKVIDHHDATYPDAGRVGLWTKADSITYFDDFRVEPL